MATASLRFETQFDPHYGQSVSLAEDVLRITAPNSGPYTFTGTNSYLLGRETVFVVDPGPLIESHSEALIAAIDGRRVEAVLLTHTHRDHCAGAPRLADRLRAPIWFGGRRSSLPRRRLTSTLIAMANGWRLRPDRVLVDGDSLCAGPMEVSVIATPGHCADHLAFGLVGRDMILCGDHVMGWSSTLVSGRDGSMADYLVSLDRLISGPWRCYLPGHGGTIPDGPVHAMALKAHRLVRNQQIIEVIGAGADNLTKIVQRVYPKLARPLQVAARMTVSAHLDYLVQTGTVRFTGPFGRRVVLVSHDVA